MTGGGRKLCNEELYNLYLNQTERNYGICSIYAWARNKNFLKFSMGKLDHEDVLKNLA